MGLEKVIDVVLKQNPSKIMIYIRDKLLFNDTINQFLKYYNYLNNLNVYTYEHLDKQKNIILIRVIE